MIERGGKEEGREKKREKKTKKPTTTFFLVYFSLFNSFKNSQGDPKRRKQRGVRRKDHLERSERLGGHSLFEGLRGG